MTWIVVGLTPILTLIIIFSIQYFVAKENKEVSNNYDSEHFIMQPAQKLMKFLRITMYLLDIIMAVVLCIGAFQDPLVVLIISPFIFALMLLVTWLVVSVSKYKLEIDGNIIFYRGPFKKKTKMFTFMDINYFVEKQSGYISNLYAYSQGNKKLFAVNSNLSCYDKFIKLINERNFKILKKRQPQ